MNCATEKKASDPDAVKKNATIIAEQTARITRIIQRLLDFARRRVGPPEQREINLNLVTLSTMELLAGQLTAARVKSRLRRAEGLPRIAGDADRIQQVLLNLSLNAVQAMPDGGQITFQAQFSSSQSVVELTVIDTGKGMPPEVAAKAFRPFFSTKQGGSGLGLATTRKIIEAHGGSITLQSEPGKGTKFTLRLPIAAG